jgi:hypothetical protein
MLNAALQYESMGWSVSVLCPPDHEGMGDWHKCSTPGKSPVHKWKEHQERRPTPDEIRKRFADHPKANVGIFLGPVSGLVRIDIDGEAGHKLLIEKSAGDLPDTLEFSSGGSGRGLLFAIPKGATVRTTSIKGDGKHQELRFQAKGAQTVLPPSIHASGRRYEWKPGHSPWEMKPAQAPKWLMDELAPAKPTPENDEAEARRVNGAAEPEYPKAHKWSDLEVAQMAVGALKVSRADDYDEWLTIGAACHSVDDSLLPDWEKFSRTSQKYKDGECRQKWSTFTRGEGGVTLGTLVKFAKDDGWVPPWEQNEHRGSGGSWASESVFRGGDEICNAVVTKAEKERHVDPLPMTEIIRRMKAKTGDWPRRMGGVLFVNERGDEIGFIEKTAGLFGYAGEKSGVPSHFITDPRCHTKPEVFEEFRRTATAYDAIEQCPHEPIMPRHYYSCGIPSPGNGDCLRELLSRFNPATEIDRDLILALFATVIWGGRGGTRPAFCITSDDGRGAGKTTVVNVAGHLVRGVLEIIAGEDMARVKTRLLSPEGLLKRIVLLDNAKSRCLSWADLEGVITAPIISGHRLYVGEMVRPNVITWCVTMNGGSYSTDLAQRSVFIKVAKPTYQGNWEESMREFIDANREAIFADLIGFLRGPQSALSKFTRWGAWDRDILSRLPEPADAQRVILERQNAADAEVEESDVITDYFRAKISLAGYQRDNVRVLIPSTIARDWLASATGERFTTIGASRALSQFIDEGKLPNLEKSPSRARGRGFVWLGDNWSPDHSIYTDLESREATRNGGRRNDY